MSISTDIEVIADLFTMHGIGQYAEEKAISEDDVLNICCREIPQYEIDHKEAWGYTPLGDQTPVKYVTNEMLSRHFKTVYNKDY